MVSVVVSSGLIMADNTATNFDVLLTVHLSIILATDQPNAQILAL